MIGQAEGVGGLALMAFGPAERLVDQAHFEGGNLGLEVGCDGGSIRPGEAAMTAAGPVGLVAVPGVDWGRQGDSKGSSADGRRRPARRGTSSSTGA